MQPDSPVARSGNLVSLQIQEFVSRHIVRHKIRAFGFQHAWENDAMENNVVLADEMHQFGLVVFPIFFPILWQQFFCGRDITNRGIEPYIKHLSFGIRQRKRHAPIQVAGHGTRLQAQVDPGFALPIDIRPPVVPMPFQNPFLQEILVAVQRQIPMLGFFLDRRAAADSALRVNQFVRAQCRTAFLALIPVSAFAMAMGASPCDVAVGQELMLFRIVILHRCLLDETAFVVKFLEKSRCRGLMHLAGSPRINIERNAEFLKRVLD